MNSQQPMKLPIKLISYHIKVCRRTLTWFRKHPVEDLTWIREKIWNLENFRIDIDHPNERGCPDWKEETKLKKLIYIGIKTICDVMQMNKSITIFVPLLNISILLRHRQ